MCVAQNAEQPGTEAFCPLWPAIRAQRLDHCIVHEVVRHFAIPRQGHGIFPESGQRSFDFTTTNGHASPVALHRTRTQIKNSNLAKFARSIWQIVKIWWHGQDGKPVLSSVRPLPTRGAMHPVSHPGRKGPRNSDVCLPFLIWGHTPKLVTVRSQRHVTTVLKDAVGLAEQGYATTAKSRVVRFRLRSEIFA